jgi:asparagine synthase (glutamine-hydrolysing)
MSGIVGSFNRDGSPADGALVGRMLGRISGRGPDGTSSWIRGPVALGHAMLHTTPESLQERQPCVDGSAGLCVVLDGRVDNCAQLVSELGMHDAAESVVTDAEVVLRAYQRWGRPCPARIIGDFAFAIWDERRQELFCARSPLGRKPFYYATCGGTFLFASEPSALFEDLRLPLEPNEGVVGEYLLCQIQGLEETLFNTVRRVPPAHSLSVSREQMNKNCFWTLDPSAEIRYRTDTEYAEHFLDLFREAVRCRMRSRGPVGAFLSGGLDSSSVVCIAQSIFDEGAAPGSGLETFSMAFPGSLCDETPYIEEVVKRGGLHSNLLAWKTTDPLFYAERAAAARDFPGYPNGNLVYNPLQELAREKGIRVMLTGVGGDEWLTGSYFHYADMLRRLQLVSLVLQMKADRSTVHGDRRLAAVLFPRNPFFRLAVRPLIPDRVVRVGRRILGRDVHPRFRPPTWLNPDFCRRIDLPGRMHARPPKRRFASYAQEDLAGILEHGGIVQEAEMIERSGAHYGVELRGPFEDRRLVEFAVALPESQRWRGADTKFILRQATRGRLPESVRLRRTKADFSHLVVETLLALETRGFWDSLEVARRGWVDAELLRRSLGELGETYRRGDDEYTKDFWPLWMVAGIEFWARSLGAPGAMSGWATAVRETPGVSPG